MAYSSPFLPFLPLTFCPGAHRSTPSGQSSAPMELEDATSFHATAATPGSMTKAEAEEEAGAEAGAVAGPDVVEEAEAAGAQSPATQLPLSVNAASCSGSSSAPPSAERLQERYPEQRSTPTRVGCRQRSRVQRMCWSNAS